MATEVMFIFTLGSRIMKAEEMGVNMPSNVYSKMLFVVTELPECRIFSATSLRHTCESMASNNRRGLKQHLLVIYTTHLLF